MRSESSFHMIALLFLFIDSSALALAQSSGIDSPVSERSYQIAERGLDYAIYRKISEAIGSSGEKVLQTNQFTLLENGLHYRDETGEWRESEDIIESFPDGAVARRGPNKAIFTPELNSEFVFDIQASDGKRIRGGVRAIQLIEILSGKTVTFSVKPSAIAKLVPPSSLVWEDAFTGIKATVVLNWKHNSWAQDVLLAEQPELPAGWDPASVRLEVLSEFIVDAEPEIRKQTINVAGQRDVEDHVLIDFGALAILMGKAFSIPDDASFNLSGATFRRDGTPVIKQWHRTDDGRHFLIESVDWTSAAQNMKNLPVRRLADSSIEQSEKALARVWPKSPAALTDRTPIEVASAEFKPSGYVVDFTIIPTGTSPTLAAGQTYYIPNTFYGANALFGAGCTVKFKNNAWLLAYSYVSFPSTGAMPVLTSRNDDDFGERIAGVSGEADSDGNPSSHKAAQAIWVYYPTSNNTVQNARIRWAQIGVEYDVTAAATLTLQNCIFQKCATGVAGSLAKISPSNLRMCNVTTPGVNMAVDCIADENSFPGTDTWELAKGGTTPARPGWPGPTNPTGIAPEIEGFASATSVNVGSQISFYVDVTGSHTGYKLQIYRMGWYGGLGGRRMQWYDTSIGPVNERARAGNFTQPAPTQDAYGMIDCLAGASPWTNPYTFTVPLNWLSGVYLAKIIALPSYKASYVIFTVREDSRPSDLYFQNSVATWQAYNPWGGNSLYGAAVACSPLTVNSTLATRVSFNRPYTLTPCANSGNWYANGAGEFFGLVNVYAGPAWECNALRWIEMRGHDVTYCTSIDTHQGSLLAKAVKGFISVGHDEYWSSAMRSNVEAARDRNPKPVNLAFLGANTCYWQIHFLDGGLRSFGCSKADWSDLWRGNVINNHESSMIGIEYMWNTLPSPGTIKIPANSTHWIFTYSSAYGAGSTTSLPRLLGSEVDGFWENANPPACAYPLPTKRSDIVVLANSDFQATWPNCPGNPITGHSYMSIYTYSASQALVFATGSNNWPWGLDSFGNSFYYPNSVNLDAQQITENLLRQFAGKALIRLP